MKRMPWYVLALVLLVGLMQSANAQQIDPKLVGTWETHDGPCTPCTLTIDAKGAVGFTQAGSAIQVVFSQGTPGPGIDLVFPLGGKADLTLSTIDVLVGSYTSPQRAISHVMIGFRRK